jgi:hypothetical protein
MLGRGGWRWGLLGFAMGWLDVKAMLTAGAADFGALGRYMFVGELEARLTALADDDHRGTDLPGPGACALVPTLRVGGGGGALEVLA